VPKNLDAILPSDMRTAIEMDDLDHALDHLMAIGGIETGDVAAQVFSDKSDPKAWWKGADLEARAQDCRMVQHRAGVRGINPIACQPPLPARRVPEPCQEGLVCPGTPRRLVFGPGRVETRGRWQTRPARTCPTPNCCQEGEPVRHPFGVPGTPWFGWVLVRFQSTTLVG
jgi:hypothetical protein